MTQQSTMQRMVGQTIEHFKRINVLCDNAGVLRFR
jgi:NADP-dependent 3-hydroxy acid dehydrogenase YdfG